MPKSRVILDEQGVGANVVSAPCYDLLCKQDDAYIKELFGDTKVLAVEAASALEWYKFADEIYGMNSFGESAKAEELFKHFGFTDVNIAAVAKKLL